MRVLIVDDDSTSRFLLQTILQQWGYEVVTAKDGIEGWQIIKENDSPKLLMIDWEMPGFTGPEICRKILQELEREQFYILMITGRGDSEDLVHGLESGADDYVAKPWHNEELKARINVGSRMLKLQERAARRQKLQGILEMAGSVCHELNQPLQVIMGYADLLLDNATENDPNRELLEKIVESVDKMGELTRKIMSITDCSTMSYKEGVKNIIDIHESSKKN
ncbi:MAG: phosphoserine phosphatase RsbU/P [Clostridiales bacterium]|jgi:DNA-binding response OmpR family regulator|nr:phosphoserine phosphatase RsbU/P [Clostridiales bacterium]MDN5281314.1 phosphoserine phosphatase RsbU/P [Candidatus Ozemobacter sp.]